MSKGLTEPHIFLASSNPHKLIRNLAGVLNPVELDKITAAAHTETKGLFELGVSHFAFAKSLNRANWRQKISRFYYGAYHIRRALLLSDGGAYTTDSSDHTKVNELPKSLKDSEMYGGKLKMLREDRNLADYSHFASESDLLISQDQALTIIEDFIRDAKAFLIQKGINV